MGQRISILPGVSRVNVFGTKSAIRIKAKPSAMWARGISIDDLSAAIKSGTSYTGAGQLDSNSGTAILRLQGQLETADQYSNLIVGGTGGAPVYLRDGLITGFGNGTGEKLMFSGSHLISARIFRHLPEKNSFGIVDAVYQQVSRAVREPEVAELFAKGGSEAMALPPAEMARAARELDRRWGEIIRQLGVTLD